MGTKVEEGGLSFYSTEDNPTLDSQSSSALPPFFSKVGVLAPGAMSTNLSRSIFVSMSDQEEDQYTSVNKGPRPYQRWFTACIHLEMM